MVSGVDFRIDSDVFIKHKDYVKFGNYVAVDKGVYCTTRLNIGDYVHIAPYCVIIGGIDGILTMEHFSGLAAGAKVVCGGDDFTTGSLMNPQVPKKYKDVVIEPITMKKFSCIGINSCILPGIKMAEGSVVGAHSLLTKDTEPWTIYAGSPARPIKIRDKNKAYKYAKELGYEI